MASVFNPVEDAPDAQTLTQEWQNWLAQPANKAGLLQFGLNMMSPMSTNQSGAGHVASAIGGAAEAAGRSEETTRAADLEEAKIDNLERRTDIMAARERRVAGREEKGVTPTALFNAGERGLRDERAFIVRLARDAARKESEAAKAAANEIPPRTIPARGPMDFIADPAFLDKARKTWSSLDPQSRALMLQAEGVDPTQDDDTEATIDETQGSAATATPSVSRNTLPPPRALQRLQEGVPTRFQNGETWTLRNGRPVRVQ